MSDQKIGVAIVAPGGYAPDEVAFHRGLEALEAQGCRVFNYYDPASKHQRFGGTDETRVAQLHTAAQNPDVHIVMALRGGYGTSRILPMLNYSGLAASGKLFVGHSDFTAFQLALLAQTGCRSFAGPMLCDDFTAEESSAFTLENFWRCLKSETHTVSWEAANNPAISISGPLWGGNLSMLMSLLGTPWCPQIQGGILFVEDINEHPYRVERMLLQLLEAGVLDRQKAVLLGDFSAYRLTDYDNAYDFDAMLAYLRQRASVPIITGLPFGHMKDKVTLAVGCDAQLDSLGETILLGMMRYPRLPV